MKGVKRQTMQTLIQKKAAVVILISYKVELNRTVSRDKEGARDDKGGQCIKKVKK